MIFQIPDCQFPWRIFLFIHHAFSLVELRKIQEIEHIKKSLLAIALLGHFTTISAFGDTCYMQQCPDDTLVDTIEGCARVKHLGCLPGGDRANSCDECYVGYERLSVIASVPAASCTYEIYLCKEICNGCFSGCISDSDWSSVNPGYEKRYPGHAIATNAIPAPLTVVRPDIMAPR